MMVNNEWKDGRVEDDAQRYMKLLQMRIIIGLCIAVKSISSKRLNEETTSIVNY